jgi:hypothetical protein
LSIISVSNHFCESNSGLGINRHNLSNNANEIWDMTSLFTVRHDLIKLIGFNQTLNNLVWTSRLLINVKSQLRIGGSNEISKFVGHSKFTFFNPVFNQVYLVLSNHWSSQFYRFDGIQFSCLKKSIEINQNWSWTTGLWKILENVNSVLISQKSSWSFSSNFGGTSIIRRSNFLVEKLLEHLISSR